MVRTSTDGAVAPVVRPRSADDVPALVEVLAAQQAGSGYPLRWPLPFPVEDFVVRAADEAAWVGLLDGAVVGHVSVTPVGDDAAAFLAAVPGRSAQDLAVVSTLFVADDARRTGTGGRLLDTAVAWVRERGRVPVLDVVPLHATALEVYRHRGWTEVGRARPAWLPDGVPDVVLMVLPDAGQGVS